eukprot:548106_1
MTTATQSAPLKSFVDSFIFRIDNKYYDLTNFCDTHPGGKEILIYAKRKAWDHTQLFSIHHVNYIKATSIMNKYLIKDSNIIDRIEELIAIEIPQRFPKQIPPSTSKYYPSKLINSGIESEYTPSLPTYLSNKPLQWTFNDLKMADCTFQLPTKGSFYWELREEIYKYFKKNKLSYYPTTFYMRAWWFVAILSFSLQFMQYYYHSYILAICIGFTYLFMGGYGHQFIHNPIQFRSYGYVCLDWIGLYSYSYMVDHVIVHHIYTNTIPDNHFDGTDPFLYVNPLTPRTYWRKVFNFCVATIGCAVAIYANYITCVINIISHKDPFYWSIFIFPFSYIFMCCLVGDIILGIKLASVSTILVSTWYFTIALMNHNQSENWNMNKLTKAAQINEKHGGWAEMQLVTSSDIGYNYGYIGSMFCLWLNYHTVHHLLPTIDMSHHADAQAILNRVSAKHGLKYHYKSAWNMYWEMLETFSVARAFQVMMESE